eukprot:763412-Hanusia_phi.AAC.1
MTGSKRAPGVLYVRRMPPQHVLERERGFRPAQSTQRLVKLGPDTRREAAGELRLWSAAKQWAILVVEFSDYQNVSGCAPVAFKGVEVDSKDCFCIFFNNVCDSFFETLEQEQSSIDTQVQRACHDVDSFTKEEIISVHLRVEQGSCSGFLAHIKPHQLEGSQICETPSCFRGSGDISKLSLPFFFLLLRAIRCGMGHIPGHRRVLRRMIPTQLSPTSILGLERLSPKAGVVPSNCYPPTPESTPDLSHEYPSFRTQSLSPPTMTTMTHPPPTPPQTPVQTGSVGVALPF